MTGWLDFKLLKSRDSLGKSGKPLQANPIGRSSKEFAKPGATLIRKATIRSEGYDTFQLLISLVSILAHLGKVRKFDGCTDGASLKQH
jgi:hypothetical protein